MRFMVAHPNDRGTNIALFILPQNKASICMQRKFFNHLYTIVGPFYCISWRSLKEQLYTKDDTAVKFVHCAKNNLLILIFNLTISTVSVWCGGNQESCVASVPLSHTYRHTQVYRVKCIARKTKYKKVIAVLLFLVFEVLLFFCNI